MCWWKGAFVCMYVLGHAQYVNERMRDGRQKLLLMPQQAPPFADEFLTISYKSTPIQVGVKMLATFVALKSW
jgi:hypothetical protein